MTWCVHSTNNCNLCFPGHRPDTSPGHPGHPGHRTDNISHTNYHLGSGVIKQGLKKIVSRLLLADKKVINLINTFSDPAPDSLDSSRQVSSGGSCDGIFYHDNDDNVTMLCPTESSSGPFHDWII